MPGKMTAPWLVSSTMARVAKTYHGVYRGDGFGIFEDLKTLRTKQPRMPDWLRTVVYTAHMHCVELEYHAACISHRMGPMIANS